MPAQLRGPRFPPLQTLHFMKDTAGFFRECAERYGDPFIAKLPMGTIAVTGDPEGLREIFSADPAVFEPLSRVVLEPVVGANSLLLLGGERHRRERRLLMPPFHGERMRAYGELMRKSVLQATEGLRPGEPLVALRMTQTLSLEIIIRAVFGVEEPERVRRFGEAIAAYMESYTPLLMLMVPMRRAFGGMGPWARFQRNTQALDALLTEQIARRRADSQNGQDILALLLSARDEEGQPLSDRELKDELLTMLIAGHETTAIGMAWALYWLLRTPEAKQRLDEELGALGTDPEPEALSRLPYLSAVCDETLRLFPVVALVSRKLLSPLVVKGHELPAGMGIMAAITLAHSNPTVFPEPGRFRPERFLERKYSPFEYLPFGGGARRCLGAAFALFEMKVVLGTLLSAHRFSLAHDRPIRPVRRNVTMAPEDGVPLLYEGRQTLKKAA
ncbi:cytochrome P450 [Hyalangium rubrum]|uniref:Cytochrome P450 n=1 Tax=Hyalangium rubrum TaxID=3103134 RepID=A0ABU5HGT9_9BACT|nr:cytochrome P450 [Hyalangium sp. s54d21]MDY7232456.1 cytochrome P450 [Hyalangium sp. s54d21]